MIRVLSMIALAGSFLSVVCLSIAVSIAGPEAIASGVWDWGRWSSHWEVSRTQGAGATREIPWSGGEALVIDLPADVTFTQADGPPKLTVHGRPDAIPHVTLDHGRLRWDGPPVHLDDLKIELSAPKITSFELNGSGELSLRDYDQPTLALRINGAGDVEAQGSARSVTLVSAGSGAIDLGELAVDRADVRIDGTGTATLAPKTWARLNVAGSGDVTLKSRPAHLETSVTGSGHVTEEPGDAARQDNEDGEERT
jgi:hypothetical protein